MKTAALATGFALMVLFGGCASPTPIDIVAAEDAFAADGYGRGVKLSFLDYSAPDAILFAPGPVNAHEALAASPDDDLTEPRAHLVWWPLYAGIAKSADLGFTTGPFARDDDRRGHYFTVWKKQADGRWKWVIDAGVGADASGEAAPGSAVTFLQTAGAGTGSPEQALKEIAAVEETIAGRAGAGLAAAYLDFLDDDSRLHSAGPPPAKLAADRDAVFAARPASVQFSALGGGASEAGDLVWTYGEAAWREGAADRRGYYVRVWQKRPAGWRLVFDEFLPPAPSAE